MLLLIVVFAYTGIELSFWSSVYPTCIANTKALGNPKTLAAITTIAMGIGQGICNLIFNKGFYKFVFLNLWF